jgi:hypothetical protein
MLVFGKYQKVAFSKYKDSAELSEYIRKKKWWYKN